MGRVIGQPYYAWVKLYLNGVDLILDSSQRPQHLLSFTQEWGSDGIPNITVELFDPNFHEIEMLLWASWNVSQTNMALSWQFGHSYHQGTKIGSPVFYGYVSNYTPRWTYNGVIITLEGKALPVKDLSSKDKGHKWRHIHEIFIDICKEQGWKVGRVDETAPVYVPEDSVKSQPVLKLFNQKGMSPQQFITWVLCRYAVRAKDGKVGYVFKLDHTKNPPEAHFWIPEQTDKPGPKKVFTIRKDRHEEWLDFSYSVNSGMAELLGQMQVTTRTVNPHNGELRYDHHDADTHRQHIPHQEAVIHTGQPVREPNRAKRVDHTTPQTEQEIELFNLSKLSLRNTALFKATLTIVGDPEVTIRPHDFIEIQNYLPDGDLHYSSGIYRVMSVRDEISGGQHTTTYELQRNSTPKEAKPKKPVKDEA